MHDHMSEPASHHTQNTILTLSVIILILFSLLSFYALSTTTSGTQFCRHICFSAFGDPRSTAIYAKGRQLDRCVLLAILGSIMVSLRRRRLLGLCSGKSSFVAPLPKNSENGNAPENSTQNVRPVGLRPSSSDNVCQPHGRAVEKGPASLNVYGASSPEEQSNQPKEQHVEIEQQFPSFSGLPIKRRKRHRRKQIQNQEPCLMRGVYFKNMKWQAAIKVDKKQIHLGTVGSQEEAARLYDRAAFMCGREPNFELSEEEKQELRQFKWDEFLAFTRRSITHKKYKRRVGLGPNKRSESPLEEDGDWDSKKGINGFLASEEAALDSSAS